MEYDVPLGPIIKIDPIKYLLLSIRLLLSGNLLRGVKPLINKSNEVIDFSLHTHLPSQWI